MQANKQLIAHQLSFDNEIYDRKLRCSFLYLQAIDPLFVTITKPLSNKRGETFCEGLK